MFWREVDRFLLDYSTKPGQDCVGGSTIYRLAENGEDLWFIHLSGTFKYQPAHSENAYFQ
jgi:hypothetical protein